MLFHVVSASKLSLHFFWWHYNKKTQIHVESEIQLQRVIQSLRYSLGVLPKGDRRKCSPRGRLSANQRISFPPTKTQGSQEGPQNSWSQVTDIQIDKYIDIQIERTRVNRSLSLGPSFLKRKRNEGWGAGVPGYGTMTFHEPYYFSAGSNCQSPIALGV